MIYLYQDSSKILKFNVTEIPVDTEIVAAYFTLKSDPTIPDADAEIFKTITADVSEEGQITDTGATDHAGVLEFYVGPSDTSGLSTSQYWFTCCKVLLDSDEYYILEESIDSARVRPFGIKKSS